MARGRCCLGIFFTWAKAFWIVVEHNGAKHEIFKSEKDANMYLDRDLGGMQLELYPHRQNYHFLALTIRLT